MNNNDGWTVIGEQFALGLMIYHGTSDDALNKAEEEILCICMYDRMPDGKGDIAESRLLDGLRP